MDSTVQAYKEEDETNPWDNSDQLDKCHLQENWKTVIKMFLWVNTKYIQYVQIKCKIIFCTRSVIKRFFRSGILRSVQPNNVNVNDEKGYTTFMLANSNILFILTIFKECFRNWISTTSHTILLSLLLSMVRTFALLESLYIIYLFQS